MKLPRGYLSYSQYKLWHSSKDQYRNRYYYSGPEFENRETIFGKQVAKLLEDEEAVKNHPVLSLVPRYKIPEHSIEIEIEGIKVKAYLDSYCPDTFAFHEYKTGKIPWDAVKVAKHEQLPWYSLLIKEKEGQVQNKCDLIWLQTVFGKKEMFFDGHVLESTSGDLELTGKIEIFPRTIYEWERKRMKDLLIATAHEIAEDYKKSA